MQPKTFEYEAEEYGLKVGVKYKLNLPLDDFTSFEEIFGHFVCKTRLLEPFHSGARKALQDFIRLETQRHHDQLAEDAVIALLDSEVDLDTTKIYSQFKEEDQASSSVVNGNEILEFSADFQYVIENCSNEQLMRLVAIEQDMTREMKALIKARDYDLDRLRRACEDTVEKTAEMTNQIEEHSYNLSILNEKLRKCNDNYWHQRQAMIQRHKNEFAEILRILKKNGSIPIERLNRFASFRQRSIEQSDSRHSFQQVERLDESFSMYIGAQLKTMHNARIVQFDRLIDVCHSHTKGDTDNVYNSRRLQSLMSLYGRDLSATVLLVGRDPLYHLHSNTDFYRLCERSAELHFDNLSEQLKKVVSLVRSTNKGRKTFNPAQQSFDHVNELDDENLLKPGDVYVTCHSNLSSAQVIFHLVADKTLETTDINSRHPCINGLRNCVRLASRNAISNLSFPLFLVEEMKPNMTVQWCITRAELVFKCMKGFLMEICSSGASSTANVPTSLKPIHYNMNFVVPQLNRDVFESVVEMFPTIFHLVPTVGQ